MSLPITMCMLVARQSLLSPIKANTTLECGHGVAALVKTDDFIC